MDIYDGLENTVASLGTGRDKAAHTRYVDRAYSYHELLTIYRTSWIAGAIVDYPAEDATRKWRLWRAEADQISKIEAEERRLGLQKKTQEALIASRLYGGAAIYINTKSQNPSEVLRESEKVHSLVVLTPDMLSPGEVVKDIDSEYYGSPEYYKLSGSDVSIHASRLVIFYGRKIPSGNNVSQWGDSVLTRCMDAIKSADSIMANVTSLVFEAKVDVFKFAGFADMMADHQDEAVVRRLRAQAAMKGINGANVIDVQDEYDQKSANFGSLPEIIAKSHDNVAGAAMIPVTRLFGRASVGLSGNGDGDERIYYDRIGHEQSTLIGPALSRLDEMIILSALVSRPPEIFYEWAPLRNITESERSDIFVKTANAARSLAGATAGPIIPLDALSDSLVNALTEMGVLPGLEALVDEYGTLSEQDDII